MWLPVAGSVDAARLGDWEFLLAACEVGAFFALSGYVAAWPLEPWPIEFHTSCISILIGEAYTTTENAERAASPKLLGTLRPWIGTDALVGSERQQTETCVKQ